MYKQNNEKQTEDPKKLSLVCAIFLVKFYSLSGLVSHWAMNVQM